MYLFILYFALHSQSRPGQECAKYKNMAKSQHLIKNADDFITLSIFLLLYRLKTFVPSILSI